MLNEQTAHRSTMPSTWSFRSQRDVDVMRIQSWKQIRHVMWVDTKPRSARNTSAVVQGKWVSEASYNLRELHAMLLSSLLSTERSECAYLRAWDKGPTNCSVGWTTVTECECNS
jgi:hypothetical protein